MPKVTAEYRAARRDEILDAALRSFATKGFQRTSMADIIAESGLSAGAIYGHFAGKRELVGAVAARTLEARRIELDARRADGGPLSPGDVMATFVDGMRHEPFGGILLQVWAEAAVDPEIRELVQTVLHGLRATLRAQLVEWAEAHPDRVDGDPEAWAARLTPVMLGLGPGFIVQRALVDDFDEEDYLAMLPLVLPH
ncbi:TetR/AcrR family transcriptional regulator [Agromyces endophyticus]|uniref:TetR/AcrR family transcriptional regulator n=1 Tax=Agromyces sp. H17E-10 TaxID=2932244 RepID=UPI001FD302D8|nr:TetR/AcrR family transcriptional regulator [Agromyces sp. H17E-10]UOQ88353.1 TetR/AcrR family transcriptional regulator [Agromyces sp. H17E-10]